MHSARGVHSVDGAHAGNPAETHRGTHSAPHRFIARSGRRWVEPDAVAGEAFGIPFTECTAILSRFTP